MTTASTQGQAAALYEALKGKRENVLERARRAAALTVPSIMPPEGHHESQKLPDPWQSMGSRGLRNLTSKLVLTLFPAHAPAFKYDLDDMAVAEIAAESSAEKAEVARGEIEKALASRERLVTSEIEKSHFRSHAYEVVRQLLTSGNYLLHIPKRGGEIKGYALDRYVCERDREGTPLHIIIKEEIARIELNRVLQDRVPTQAEPQVERTDVASLVKAETTDQPNDNSTPLYTCIKRTKDGYVVFQEADGKVIPGTEGLYPVDELEWLPVRLTSITGEHYGRGYVEELIGDLQSLEGLTQTLVEGTAAISKVVFLVDPSAQGRIRAFAKAENGDYVVGNQNDVTVIQAEKRADFSVVMQQIQTLTQALSYGFLLNTAVQRNGERVTAEEIRYVAGELEDGLGGIYSMLSHELQLRVVQAFERRMEYKKQLPALPEDIATPAIVTGIDALGRGQDLRNLISFIEALFQTMGPEVAQRYIKVAELIKRLGNGFNIDMAGLIASQAEIDAAEEQAQIMALSQHLGPEALKQMGGMAQQQMQQENAAE